MCISMEIHHTRDVMKIFLSWSGDYSKKIAFELKNELESIFKDDDLTVFMSEEDIHSGTKWYTTIESNLKESECLILCLTKENIRSPWVYFEAGGVAISSKKTNVIPLLFDVIVDAKSPLMNFNNVKFDGKHYTKMLEDIKDKGKFNSLNDEHFHTIVNGSYRKLSARISKTLSELKGHDFENSIEIFPTDIKKINKGSIFLGSPMASLKDNEYINFRDEMLRIKEALDNIKEIKCIYYPGENNNDPKCYEGNLKAMDGNLRIIKQCEYMFFVYPKKLPTSMLLEIGYGIALSKRIIIYTPNREILPFLLKDADGIIKNITIHTYPNYNKLIESINSNGLALFK